MYDVLVSTGSPFNQQEYELQRKLSLDFLDNIFIFGGCSKGANSLICPGGLSQGLQRAYLGLENALESQATISAADPREDHFQSARTFKGKVLRAFKSPEGSRGPRAHSRPLVVFIKTLRSLAGAGP